MKFMNCSLQLLFNQTGDDQWNMDLKRYTEDTRNFTLKGKGNYACIHVHETHNITMQGFANGD